MVHSKNKLIKTSFNAKEREANHNTQKADYIVLITEGYLMENHDASDKRYSKKKKKTRKNEHTTHRSIEERKKKATRFESINEAGARFESCCVFSGTPRDD